MKILLDTHILIWFLQGNEMLSKEAREAVETADKVYYSILSIFEIELKRITRPDKMPVTMEKILRLCEKANFIQMPLKISHIEEMKNLSRPENAPPHKDPFDRLMIAQAIAEDMIFMTHDKRIAEYLTPNIYKV